MRHYADKMAYSRRIEKEGREENANGGGVVYQSAPEPAEGPWYSVDSGSFTATPASTSRLTMSDTSALALGMALRYSILGDNYYGVVAAISDNAYIDIMGAPLGGDVTALWHSDSKAQPFQIFIAGASFAATSADLLDSIMHAATRWPFEVAHLVGFSTKLKTADGSAGPKINVALGGNNVSTNDSSHGVQATASWVNNSLVAISATYYTVNWLDAVTVACTVAAGTGNAADLSVDLHFVLE